MNKALTRDLTAYQHGYCYIYAIALSHVFDKGVTLVWDTEAMTDDLIPIPEDCLVHAFVTTDNCTAMDAGGLHEDIEMLIAQFPFNSAKMETVSILKMLWIAEKKGWEVPSDNEIDILIAHVKKTFDLTNTKSLPETSQ